MIITSRRWQGNTSIVKNLTDVDHQKIVEAFDTHGFQFSKFPPEYGAYVLYTYLYKYVCSKEQGGIHLHLYEVLSNLLATNATTVTMNDWSRACSHNPNHSRCCSHYIIQNNQKFMLKWFGINITDNVCTISNNGGFFQQTRTLYSKKRNFLWVNRWRTPTIIDFNIWKPDARIDVYRGRHWKHSKNW